MQTRDLHQNSHGLCSVYIPQQPVDQNGCIPPSEDADLQGVNETSAAVLQRDLATQSRTHQEDECI